MLPIDLVGVTGSSLTFFARIDAECCRLFETRADPEPHLAPRPMPASKDARLVNLGLMVARVLEGAWRREPPSLNLSPHDLGRTASLLVGSGAGALAWNRVSRVPGLRDKPEAAILQETYRTFAVEEMKYAASLRFLVEIFAEAGLEPLFFKGSVVGRHYSGAHLRPSGDIDICAPPGRYDESRDLLRRYSISRLSSPGTGLSQETGQFAVNFAPGERMVDLHSSLDRFGLPSLEAVFARSQVIKLGETSIRVPSAEDHLRLVAIHLLSHGAWRPVWLCDIAAMLEDLPQDFDWGRCLGDEPRIARWISSAIELAHRLLGACVDRVPPSSRIQRLPKWLTRTVLNEWQTPVAARYGGTSLAFVLAHPQRLVDPRKLVVELKTRWPNGIQATIETGGHFNDVTRLPYQVLAFGQARIQGFALRSRLREGKGTS